MIPAFLVLLLCQLAGEILSRSLHLPLPGPVIGMLLLLGGTATVPALTALVRPLAEGLLAHLSLLYVPAGVGVVGHLDTISRQGIPLFITLAVSVVLSMAAAALAFTVVARLTGQLEDHDAITQTGGRA